MQEWWRPQSLDEERAARWAFGPVDLWIRRSRHEWRLAIDRRTGRSGEDVAVEADREFPADTTGMELVRFGMERTGPTVRVLPLLAPLPVVCRPEQPFHLLPQGEVTAFIGSPLWLRVEAEDGALAHEIDLHRPSSTWFGPDTRTGERCYANRIRIRLHRERLQFSPTRAMTRLRLRNRSPQVLTVRQFKLPVPSLDLFLAREGGLWSEALQVDFEPRGEVGIEVLPSQDPDRLTRIASARQPRTGSRLIAALTQVLR